MKRNRISWHIIIPAIRLILPAVLILIFDLAALNLTVLYDQIQYFQKLAAANCQFFLEMDVIRAILKAKGDCDHGKKLAEKYSAGTVFRLL